ncbi:Conidiation protein 6-domain-containing protein [Hypoxylon sp. FL1284]|nr:Conidiation protein 6-domain-containing protein [Hypoxylon sp. FL1284]
MSNTQQKVPKSADTEPDPENVYRGHKATISNPNTSEAAKEHSRQVMEEMTDEPPNSDEKDPGNVARGLKASINNHNVSDEARERAKEKLNDLEG